MLKFFTMEYEHADAGTKKVNLVCESQDDAIYFMRNLTKNKMKSITNLGNISDIHAYTDNAIDYISKKLGYSKTTEEGNAVEPKSGYLCPWCEKSFEKASVLKAHMNRSHNVKEQKE